MTYSHQFVNTIVSNALLWSVLGLWVDATDNTNWVTLLPVFGDTAVFIEGTIAGEGQCFVGPSHLLILDLISGTFVAVF